MQKIENDAETFKTAFYARYTTIVTFRYFNLPSDIMAKGKKILPYET